MFLTPSHTDAILVCNYPEMSQSPQIGSMFLTPLEGIKTGLGPKGPNVAIPSNRVNVSYPGLGST